MNNQKEILLNEGVAREAVIKNELCEILEPNPAFDNLRRGYPDKPFEERCSGKEFRENAEIILKELAKKTLENLEKPDLEKTVVLLPWRSGLAFAKSYIELEVNNFYHVSSKRNEETLETLVDFESGEITPDNFIVIADPMLATGNTIIDAIKRIISKGILPEKIIINSVVAAPVGVKKIKDLYPQIKIIVGALDDKLDEKGYIVPGLGDFGDKYFTDFSEEDLNKLIGQFNIDEVCREKMKDRFLI